MPLADHSYFKTTVKNQLGFTLLELIVTIAIAGILFGIAVPSFNTAIRNNRLTTIANDLITAMNIARSEAVKRGMSVTVRRVDNLSSTKLGAAANWENGWDVFTDVNANGTFNDNANATLCEAGEDCLVKTFPALATGYTLRGNAVFPAFIRFRSDGQSNAALGANGLFMVCDDRDNNATAEADTSRLIMVNSVGRVTLGVDTDTPKNGIPNDPNNANADSTDCTP